MTAQIQGLRNDLVKLKSRERGLGDALKGMATERVAAYLDSQLREIDTERQEIELGIARLERERTALQRAPFSEISCAKYLKKWWFIREIRWVFTGGSQK